MRDLFNLRYIKIIQTLENSGCVKQSTVAVNQLIFIRLFVRLNADIMTQRYQEIKISRVTFK